MTTEIPENIVGELASQCVAAKRHACLHLEETVPVVEQIISERVISVKHIETVLDRLLDVGMWGVGRETFNRLNMYYSAINHDNAQAYFRLWREFNEEESVWDYEN